MAKYKNISFFSGAMGLDLGLERAGIETVACNEIDKYCIETIRTNKPNLPVITDGIEKVSTDELLKEANLKKGEVFMVSGGPPCQAFSTAGKRKSIDDPRGNLILEYLKKIDEIQPEYFILENVRGLLSSKINPELPGPSKLEQREKDSNMVLNLLLKTFDNMHYKVNYALLNAADYGSPQKRSRVVFIGKKGNEKVPLPEKTHSKHPEKDDLKPWRTLKDAFQGLKDKEKEHINYGEKRLAYLKQVPQGGNWRSLPEEIQEEAMGKSYRLGGGKTGFYRRLSFDQPSPTITTVPNMPATDLCHPTENRPLTVMEYKRIQEFPDDWNFSDGTMNKYRQIGNAVPLSLGEAVGKAIIGFHEKKIKPKQTAISTSIN